MSEGKHPYWPPVSNCSTHQFAYGRAEETPFFILSFVDIFTCGIAGRHCQLLISDNHSKHLFCDRPKLVIGLRCCVGQFHAHVGQDRKTLEVNYHQSFQTDNINFVIMVLPCNICSRCNCVNIKLNDTCSSGWLNFPVISPSSKGRKPPLHRVICFWPIVIGVDSILFLKKSKSFSC